MHFVVSQLSPNIVPFHMLGIVSSCAIVTLSLRGAVFYDIRLFKNVATLKSGSEVTKGHPMSYHSIYSDLETQVRGHSRSSKIIPFNPAPMTSH